MKYILPIALFSSLTAHANISCKGAIQLSLQNAEAITVAMRQLPVTAEVALTWIERDQNNLGNIKAGCRDYFDAKIEFCSAMPELVISRATSIHWNISGTDEEKAVVLSANQNLQNEVSKLCL